MRDLTEEELKLAPDWATHYAVDCADDVIYQCEKLCWWKSLEQPLSHSGMDSFAVELPKKPFDITNHEFSDKDIRLSNLCESKIELVVDDCGIEHYFTLQKSDAIAIAKALGVTGEDFK